MVINPESKLSALELARIKAREALQHLQRCREHVKAMKERLSESESASKNWNLLHWRSQLAPISTALMLTALKAEGLAQERYIDAAAALWEAQNDAGMSEREIELDRNWVTAGDLAREGE